MTPSESQRPHAHQGDRIDVCLVALGALPVVDPNLQRPIGGTETRAWQFAKGLAARDDASASLVVRTTHSRPAFERNGVTILPRHERLFTLYEAVGHSLEKSPRFPGIRIRRLNPNLIWQLPVVALHRTFLSRPRDPRRPCPFFQQIPADVFVAFGVQSTAATVIASAHETSRPAVLVLGSDSDLDERYQSGSAFVSPYGDRGDVCHHILMRADAIVAQTEKQQRLLRDRFGRESTLIQNPIDAAEWDERASASLNPDDTAGLDRFILWVGRAESVHKRPLICLELARMLPDVDFLMILNPRDPAVQREVYHHAPPNVRCVSHVPFERIPSVFARAAALVSTSSLEGFPNVFLQAALSRVPIASLEVGEELLSRFPGSRVAHGDLSALSAFLRDAWTGNGPDSNTLDVARNVVINEHGLERQTTLLAEVLCAARS